MEFKILESNGVENENVDGAALNNAMAGGKDGILKDILNDCLVHVLSGNSIAIETGVMMIQGFRIKITEPWIKTLSSSPATDVEYQIVAKITLSYTRDVSFEIICRQKGELIKENLFKTENGVYEAEIACFKHNSSGEIVDLVKTMGFLSFFEEPTKDEVLTAPTIILDGDTLTMTATDERTETFAIFVNGVEMATVENTQEPETPDTPTEQLTAPTISLDGDTLTITATDERTERFAILVDGVEVVTVDNLIPFTVCMSDRGLLYDPDTKNLSIRSGATWREWVSVTDYATSYGGYKPYIDDTNNKVKLVTDYTLRSENENKAEYDVAPDDVIEENAIYYFYSNAK